MVILASVIWVINQRGSGPGYSWIHSWYSYKYSSMSRSGAVIYTERGEYIVIGMIIVVAIIFAFGIAPSSSNSDS